MTVAPSPASPPAPSTDDLSVTFLAEGEQTAAQVAKQLADFIRGAGRSLDFAAYDFRLSPEVAQPVVAAIRAAYDAGVDVRIAYDADKPEPINLLVGMDPAPPGTGAFVRSLGVPWRRIGGMKLMHDKYIVRDAGMEQAAVWTGSTNFTDDSWTLQENNIVVISSPVLAESYRLDFKEMWSTGSLENTGDVPAPPAIARYKGEPVAVQVWFAPACGAEIDHEVARLAGTAKRRIRVCSMLLNSGPLIAALTDQLDRGQVPVSGVYDRTQMESVYVQWEAVPRNRWKIEAVRSIVQTAELIGKNSTPYSPTSRHDFMHNKILVVDDTVITGSYNFSRSAELNAENIVFLTSPALADAYSAYIDHLMQKYGG